MTGAGAAPRVAVERLRVRYPAATVPVLDEVSLTIARGESVALVGESGAGKSTFALALLRLLPRGTEVEGSIRLDGRELLALGAEQMRSVRGREIAIVFQDAIASLHAVRTVGGQLREVAAAHPGLPPGEVRARALALFERLGLPDPERAWESYPFQLSGGMCQRVLLAMALLHRPSLLIADEPTSALDADSATAALAVLDGIRREQGASLLLITHDPALAARHADRVVTLADGRVEPERG